MTIGTTPTNDVVFGGIGPISINRLESAIVATLDPGEYTTIVTGKDGGTGVALVEVYDLDGAGGSQLANISTRGFVQSGDDVMIGGFILAASTANGKVVVRAIGPSLAAANVPNPLSDPVLELHDSDGAIVAANDNWMDGPDAQAITALGLAPANTKESAVLANLPSGSYTGIVKGVGGATGVGLVEAYTVQ